MAGMYERRRSAALGLIGLSVVCAAVGVADSWGWADIPGGLFVGLVVAPNLLLAGSLVQSAARYAEGERRREAHRQSSPQRLSADPALKQGHDQA
jgi:hypothetical protein